MVKRNNIKYYAVRRGYQTGIYEEWEMCRKNVRGYPGAEYKKFDDYGDAVRYITDKGDCLYHAFCKIPQTEQQVFDQSSVNMIRKNISPDKQCFAYVDGSYNIENGLYGYGVVFCYNNVVEEFYDSGSEREYVSMRNVAGEIHGALKAVTYAVFRKLEKITIYYDYMGIEKWATGEWKANKAATKEYAKLMKEAMKLIQIEFVKVAAHTGVSGNERADQLAKMGCGIL